MKTNPSTEFWKRKCLTLLPPSSDQSKESGKYKIVFRFAPQSVDKQAYVCAHSTWVQTTKK